jgi:NADH-quinone oxidoreductase subunit L
MLEALWVIPALPLAGAVITGFLGRRLGDRAVGAIACGAVGLAFLASLGAVAGLIGRSAEDREAGQLLFTWIGAGDFRAEAGLLLDPLSAVMILVVSGVGFLIHVYATGYMRGDRDYARFFAFLNLFVFSMLMLVLADNYLLLYLFWEAVGLCSYLLIGFWFERPSAAEAGKKAFVVNRVGDFGFGLGVMLLWTSLGTLDYAEVFARAEGAFPVGSGTVTAITLLLFLGATGKSAQLPLYVWLPDAMEGPTPVSALIHAATMVTAGVYMVARSAVLFDLAPLSLTVVAWVGALTAAYAATIALAQYDIKRIIAYSTISHLGFMFLGLGVGAYASGIFHLMTHAAFKALLFLGAGSVMHALGGEQDVRRMGGLWRHLPVTGWTFLVAALANAGIFFFAGFWSKDEILAAAYRTGHLGPWGLGMAGAFLSACYIFRLFFLTFAGPSRVSPEAARHLHESPAVMTVPLGVLAALAAFAGFLGVPPDAGPFHRFLAPAFPAAEVAGHGAEGLALAVGSLALAVAGLLVAWHCFLRRPEAADRLAAAFPGLHRMLREKYWVDELYDAAIVQPIRRGSLALWEAFDDRVVDGSVNGVAALVDFWSRVLRRLQTGFVLNYALGLLIGVVLIVGYLALGR